MLCACSHEDGQAPVRCRGLRRDIFTFVTRVTPGDVGSPLWKMPKQMWETPSCVSMHGTFSLISDCGWHPLFCDPGVRWGFLFCVVCNVYREEMGRGRRAIGVPKIKVPSLGSSFSQSQRAAPGPHTISRIGFLLSTKGMRSKYFK